MYEVTGDSSWGGWNWMVNCNLKRWIMNEMSLKPESWPLR